MNILEYEEEMKSIERSYEIAKIKLYKKCALANNPYNIGDIIQDHCQIIQIKSVKTYVGLKKMPECVYNGMRLKKDLTPYKSKEYANMYQCNVKRLLK